MLGLRERTRARTSRRCLLAGWEEAIYRLQRTRTGLPFSSAWVTDVTTEVVLRRPRRWTMSRMRRVLCSFEAKAVLEQEVRERIRGEWLGRCGSRALWKHYPGVKESKRLQGTERRVSDPREPDTLISNCDLRC